MRWTWLLSLLRYFFIDKRIWWYLLSSCPPPETFSDLFCSNIFMNTSSLRNLRFLRKLFLRVSSIFFRDSMGNSYCKKDDSECSGNYSNEPTRKQEECSYGKFYCLLSKFGKTIVFYVVIRRKKTPAFCCFLSAKNWHSIFMQICS